MTLRRLAPIVIFIAVFAAVFLLNKNEGQPRLAGNEAGPSASSTPELFVPTNTVAVVYKQILDEGPLEADDEDFFKVVRVIDGDTIEIEGGERVRYIGMDTPETKHPRKSVQCFGKEAARKNAELALGKNARLEKDVSERDKYGRLLRYVYVGNLFVNLELVKQGYAYAATFPPDVKYQEVFREAQREAREERKGLWGECR